MKTVLELEDLANRAIKAALNQQWADAIQLNQQYLAESPENLESLNRLARALHETGQTDQARQTYQKVLSLDPYNAIAQKNLDKLGHSAKASSAIASNELFLEEPGKTRSATIEKPNLKKLANYSSGQPLALTEHQDGLAITDSKGAILGYLEESLATHLQRLIKLGNTYSVHLMTTSDQPQVFLRETHQSAAASKFISFTKPSTSLAHLSNSRDRHLTTDEEQLDTSTTDEDLDNWDAENAESDNLGDDDFASVSLEQLREEEDEANYNAGDY